MVPFQLETLLAIWGIHFQGCIFLCLIDGSEILKVEYYKWVGVGRQ